MQFWPRKRSRRPYPWVRSWALVAQPKLLGFIGYKAGMTHILYNETRSNARFKGEKVMMPVTILECPPITPRSLRFYKKTVYGLHLVGEVYPEKGKKQGKKPDVFDEVRLVIETNPEKTGIGKKVPDVMEITVSGSNNDEKVKYALDLINKDIKVSEVVKEGQFVDVHGVTKGKGYQGTVKRYGVKIRQHKSEKVKRGVGTLGPWTPKKVSYRVPQPGKMGYHARTEYNKQVIKISANPEEINPKSGLIKYGNVKNEYLLIKGSLPGSRKRPLIVTECIRPLHKPEQKEIIYIHK